MSSSSDIDPLDIRDMLSPSTRTARGKKELGREKTAEREVAHARYEEFVEEEDEKKKRDKKALIKLKSVERAIDVLMDPDSKKTDRSNASLKLRTVDKSLVGRQLMKQALESRGITADTYAEMIDISAKVGRGSATMLNADGEEVPVMVESKTALEARKHVTGSMEKVHDVDRTQADSAPNIVVIVGAPFKDAAESIDKRNQGHPVEPPQWSEPGDSES